MGFVLLGGNTRGGPSGLSEGESPLRVAAESRR